MPDPGVLAVAAALLGVAAGSFINVVAFRLPRMMEATWHAECRALLNEADTTDAERLNLLWPSSACPACEHPIPLRENIPVVSYLMLRARCSACGWRIPARYPIVEICGALVAAAATLRFGLGIEAAGACVLGWGLLALSVIDIETRLLPDAITIPLLWLGLSFNLLAVFAPLEDSVTGAMAGYLVLWTVYQGFRIATGREGFGFGDFKLLALLGAWLGWQSLPFIIVVASAIGAGAGIIALVRRRVSRDSPLPFGPCLAIAGLIELYCGDLPGGYRFWFDLPLT